MEVALAARVRAETSDGEGFDELIHDLADAEKRLADGVEHAGVIDPRIGGVALIHQDQRGDIMQFSLALDVEAIIGTVTGPAGDLSGHDGVDVEFWAVWLAFRTLRLRGERGEFFAQIENDGAMLRGGALSPRRITVAQ
jgi:hypothetical protein